MTANGERTVLNDRYEIQQRIGRGGMADVFLARDLLLDRPVAIKVLFPEFATDPNFVERFRREAQSAASLNHPNIVGVYDWGKHSNTYFMAMEYVEGRTLADILRANGHVQSTQAAEIGSEISAALGFAHRNGVVHRDIKPANILIGTGGQVKVADFGIARAMNAPTESNLTQAGAVMGTATYFSPEQAQGAQPDPRSDLYSLGIVLYEMVAGKPPFTGENPVSIAYKQVHDAPQPLNQLVADVPRPFEAIVAKLLAKNPAVRYSNAEGLREDLRRFRNGEPVQALQELAGPAPAAGAAAAAAATTAIARQPAATAVFPTLAGAQPGVTTAMPRTQVQGPAAGPPPDYYESAPNRTWYVIAGVLALIALAIGAIVLVNVLGGDDAEAFVLEDVTTMPFEEASARLADLELVVVGEPQAREGVAEGIVWQMDPPGGTEVSSGQSVTLFYVPRAELFVIPDVARKPLEQATQELRQLGLVVTEPAGQEVNPEVPAGSVIRTEPAAGQQAKQGDPIRIIVSAGPGQVTVPAVDGLSESDATQLLQGAEYAFVVSVREQESATVPEGQAVNTNPAAGTPVPKGSAVTLFVSTGPPPVTVPPVVGLTEDQARAKLEANELVVQVEDVPVAADSSNVGRVVRQGVTSGVRVPPGTVVKIGIGRAIATTTTATTTTTTLPPTTTAAPTTTTTTTPATTTSSGTTTTTTR